MDPPSYPINGQDFINALKSLTCTCNQSIKVKTQYKLQTGMLTEHLELFNSIMHTTM